MQELKAGSVSPKQLPKIADMACWWSDDSVALMSGGSCAVMSLAEPLGLDLLTPQAKPFSRGLQSYSDDACLIITRRCCSTH